MNELSGLKVAMFTTGHPANDARIFYKEAVTLAASGAKVQIIYPDFAGQKAPPKDNINISFHGVRAQKGLKYRLCHGRDFYHELVAEKYNVVHCHEPDALFWAIKARHGQPQLKIIYDSHEMWGAVFAERQPACCWKPAESFYNFWERKLLSQCDGAIGAAGAITSYLQKSLKNRPVKTIYNVPDSKTFPPLAPAPLSDKIILVHEGHLTFDRGLKTIAAAIKEVSRDYPIMLKIVGDTFGKAGEWLENYKTTNHLEEVIVKTGWLSYDQVGPALASGHIGINGHIYNPNNAICAPNKCFNYLYYGLAQIAARLPSSHYQTLADEGCALLYKPSDSHDMAKAIKTYLQNRELLAKHRQQALYLSQSKYRWEHMEPLLLALYKSICEMLP